MRIKTGSCRRQIALHCPFHPQSPSLQRSDKLLASQPPAPNWIQRGSSGQEHQTVGIYRPSQYKKNRRVADLKIYYYRLRYFNRIKVDRLAIYDPQLAISQLSVSRGRPVSVAVCPHWSAKQPPSPLLCSCCAPCSPHLLHALSTPRESVASDPPARSGQETAALGSPTFATSPYHRQCRNKSICFRTTAGGMQR